MNGDTGAIAMVTAWTIASTSYARFASSLIKPGKLRLLALLPVVILFGYLPCLFTSINLRFAASFSLSWLSVFKLLLLSFGRGPLSPSLPLAAFASVASLPIKIRESSKPTPDRPLELALLSCLKLGLLALLGSIHQRCPWLLPATCCAYLYLFLELVIGCATLFASSVLGLSLEPYFNAPYLSASLQDYWGRRWNLMVTGILRPSVYHPVRSRFGTSAGMVAAFFVSGLMHEVIYYHVTFRPPTGEVVFFFFIQGICTAAEVKAKKAGWWRLPECRSVAVPLTLTVLVSMAHWLCFPPLVRAGWVDLGLEEFKNQMYDDVGSLERRHICSARNISSLGVTSCA